MYAPSHKLITILIYFSCRRPLSLIIEVVSIE
nr:MAG TPA: hypothetical protein [Caudoviricetes sp.]